MRTSSRGVLAAVSLGLLALVTLGLPAPAGAAVVPGAGVRRRRRATPPRPSPGRALEPTPRRSRPPSSARSRQRTEQRLAGARVRSHAATIRVHVHVMAARNGTGNVSRAVLEDQVDVLDRTYTAGAESTDAAETGFTFTLAGVQPVLTTRGTGTAPQRSTGSRPARAAPTR